jgi:hypothetical protein
MDTWKDVENLEPGQEARVALAEGWVHGIVFEKDDTNHSITFVNAIGEKHLVEFEDEEPA